MNVSDDAVHHRQTMRFPIEKHEGNAIKIQSKAHASPSRRRKSGIHRRFQGIAQNDESKACSNRGNEKNRHESQSRSEKRVKSTSKNRSGSRIPVHSDHNEDRKSSSPRVFRRRRSLSGELIPPLTSPTTARSTSNLDHNEDRKSSSPRISRRRRSLSGELVPPLTSQTTARSTSNLDHNEDRKSSSPRISRRRRSLSGELIPSLTSQTAMKSTSKNRSGNRMPVHSDHNEDRKSSSPRVSRRRRSLSGDQLSSLTSQTNMKPRTHFPRRQSMAGRFESSDHKSRVAESIDSQLKDSPDVEEKIRRRNADSNSRSRDGHESVNRRRRNSLRASERATRRRSRNLTAPSSSTDASETRRTRDEVRAFRKSRSRSKGRKDKSKEKGTKLNRRHHERGHDSKLSISPKEINSPEQLDQISSNFAHLWWKLTTDDHSDAQTSETQTQSSLNESTSTSNTGTRIRLLSQQPRESDHANSGDLNRQRKKSHRSTSVGPKAREENLQRKPKSSRRSKSIDPEPRKDKEDKEVTDDDKQKYQTDRYKNSMKELKNNPISNSPKNRKIRDTTTDDAMDSVTGVENENANKTEHPFETTTPISSSTITIGTSLSQMFGEFTTEERANNGEDQSHGSIEKVSEEYPLEVLRSPSMKSLGTIHTEAKSEYGHQLSWVELPLYNPQQLLLKSTTTNGAVDSTLATTENFEYLMSQQKLTSPRKRPTKKVGQSTRNDYARMTEEKSKPLDDSCSIVSEVNAADSRIDVSPDTKNSFEPNHLGRCQDPAQTLKSKRNGKYKTLSTYITETRTSDGQCSGESTEESHHF